MEVACAAGAPEAMIRVLAAVVEALDAAAENPKALQSLLTTLLNHTDGIFSAVALFKGGDAGDSFVITTERGASPAKLRSWMHWPLRRLFTRMKPVRIRNPVDKRSIALAIPFSYGIERYVVLAPLAHCESTPLTSTFFNVLECITIRERREVLSSDVPMTPPELNVAAFSLPDDLYQRIEATVRRRGWTIHRVQAFSDLANLFDIALPDIMVVDAGSLDDPLAAVTTIHRVANSAALRLVAFADGPIALHGSAALVDCELPRDADDEAIFRALKELARDTHSRRRASASDADRAARHVTTVLTLQELAAFAARRAAELMRGWACCVLIDEHGGVSRAEYPVYERPVLSAIPQTIFRDAPLFDIHAGESFLAEITNNPAERMNLMALRPVSGASIPIAFGSGESRGVLTGCSLQGWADSTMFEAVERLARIVAALYVSLIPSRASLPVFHSERSWQRLHDRALGLEVYRSTDCRTPWQYRPLSDESALLTLGLNDDGALHQRLSAPDGRNDATLLDSLAVLRGGLPAFAGIVDFSTLSIRFATAGFSPPIALSRPGPAASIQMINGMITGNVMLGVPGGALVCDVQLWRWLDSQPGGELRRLLDSQKPIGLASIVTLD